MWDTHIIRGVKNSKCVKIKLIDLPKHYNPNRELQVKESIRNHVLTENSKERDEENEKKIYKIFYEFWIES